MDSSEPPLSARPFDATRGEPDAAATETTRGGRARSETQPPAAAPPGTPPEPSAVAIGGGSGGIGRLGRGLRLAFWTGLALVGVLVALLVLYRFVDPPFTAFTAVHRLSGGKVVQAWVPLERISPHVMRAVIASEDGRFCSHHGVDLGEIEAAIERARDGIPRGASTISMQVIKNLFLWQGKSYLRKAIEIPLTMVMELIWPKRRILEVYLNIAEWGPGIYGVEAASQFHFEKPAFRLNEREAALLAVALPNPAERDAGDPGPGTQRLADRIQARVKGMSRSFGCIEPAARQSASRQ